DRIKDGEKLLEPLAQDSNPRVRLQAVVASSYLKEANAIDVAYKASLQPTDKFLDYGIKQTVFALKKIWLSELESGNENANPDRLNFIVRTDGSADTLDAVRKLFRTENRSDRKVLAKSLIQNGGKKTYRWFWKMGLWRMIQRSFVCWLPKHG